MRGAIEGRSGGRPQETMGELRRHEWFQGLGLATQARRVRDAVGRPFAGIARATEQLRRPRASTMAPIMTRGLRFPLLCASVTFPMAASTTFFHGRDPNRHLRRDVEIAGNGEACLIPMRPKRLARWRSTWVPARDRLDATRTRGFGLMLRMNIRGLTEDDVMAEIAPIDEVLMILRGYDRGVYTRSGSRHAARARPRPPARPRDSPNSCPTTGSRRSAERVTPVPEGPTVWIWGGLLKPGVDRDAHEAEMRRHLGRGADNWRVQFDFRTPLMIRVRIRDLMLLVLHAAIALTIVVAFRGIWGGDSWCSP